MSQENIFEISAVEIVGTYLLIINLHLPNSKKNEKIFIEKFKKPFKIIITERCKFSK